MWKRTDDKDARKISGMFMHDRLGDPILFIDDPKEELESYLDRYIPFEIGEDLLSPGSYITVTIKIHEPLLP